MVVSQGIYRQYDIRGIVGHDLTPEVAHAVGRAYAARLRNGGDMKGGAVAVGRDNRPSGAALRDALVNGLTTGGVDVVDIGIVPTPVVYWALHNLDVIGGIQITGSHNPPEYNGFKLCVGKQSLHGEGIQELYALREAPAARHGGRVTSADVLERYAADLLSRTGKLPRTLKVVIDCGNGTASVIARALFDRMGIDARYLFCESDGTFPNHHPDPTIVENLHDLIAAVRDDHADLGIAFDGDADRIGVVDPQGEIVWGDHILILYARDVLARTGAGQPIIFDVKCSQALPHAIEQAGGTPIMWKTGHSLIKDKMLETGAPLAGEMSGHMFFREGFYGHDDALYAAARLLRILATGDRSLPEHLADVPKFVSTPELRVDVPEERKFELVARAAEHFAREHEVVAVDGARVLFGDGWGLVRASNTQPVLVMRFEATSEERLAQMRAEMEGWLRHQGVKV